jgi:hypothetical protein
MNVAPRPYASNWEHLADELGRLDGLIRSHLGSEQSYKPDNIFDHLRGLVLIDEEIADLLAEGKSDALASSRGGADPLLARARARIEERLAASLREDQLLALPFLSRLFNLTAFERQALLICLAPELDRKYEKLYAYLQDDVTQKKPSVCLALDLLCRTMPEKIAAREFFESQAPLFKYRLLRMAENSPEGPPPLLARGLKLDDRIASFLLGFNRIDDRLEDVARSISPDSKSCFAPVNEELRDRIAGLMRTEITSSDAARRRAIFHLYNSDGVDRLALAVAVAHEFDLPLLIGDVEQMVGRQDFEESIWLFARESMLQPAMLCFENFDCLLDEQEKNRAQLRTIFKAIRTFTRVAFICGDRSFEPREFLEGEMFVALDLDAEDRRGAEEIWGSWIRGDHQFSDDVDVIELAARFKLTPGQIGEALNAAETAARWREPDDARITMVDLHRACRAQSTPKLDALARKLEPKYKWQDIILPDDQLAQLGEICEQARHRLKVYGEWGFGRKLSRGRGLNALFSGPPGTGKTMAAEVIAKALQLDIYQIDLSQVVSKYIGETEKNLHRIFAEARSSNAILFFDEADALFGKRSEVRDAHDRYANIEVGYLLQKMEEYEGIAILATNLRDHLDAAFVRRMQFIVEFPFPDEEYRRRIWQALFPPEAPLGDDVDFGLLAREIKLAGGNIKNIGLAAAFYAAGDGNAIGAPHLMKAAQREFQKMGREWNDPRSKRNITGSAR